MCDNFLEKVAYVKASKHRTNILKFMQNELCTPKQISDGIGVRPNHISNLLAQLKDYNLVYCATPNIYKGRYYSLTDDGKRVLEFIQEKEQ